VGVKTMIRCGGQGLKEKFKKYFTAFDIIELIYGYKD